MMSSAPICRAAALACATGEPLKMALLSWAETPSFWKVNPAFCACIAMKSAAGCAPLTAVGLCGVMAPKYPVMASILNDTSGAALKSADACVMEPEKASERPSTSSPANTATELRAE